MSTVSLAWRQALRDLRAGELRLLLVAVALAVAALSAVGFFADRLQRGLSRDAGALLGGDAVLASDQPAPAAARAQALALGLSVSSNIGFPSMARAPDAQGGATRLVAVKAVDAAYPLRGRLGLSPQGVASGAPPRGKVWVDAALLEALGLKLGQSLLLGDASLELDRVVLLEPDRGAGFMSFAPRVMVNADDLPATGLVQPASRITYRLAVAAPADAQARVREWVQWVEAQTKAQGWRGLRVEALDSGRPEMQQTLARAEKFLNLVALLTALLAAVAVAIAARDFAQRHLDDCAVLRVLGAPQRVLAGAYALEFGAVGLAASAIGLALGWAVHHGFVLLLAGLVDAQLPPAGPMPWLLGLGVGLALLVAFGLPPVLQLARVPPLRVIRRDLGLPRAASLAVLGAGLVGLAALLMATAADLRLGALAVGGFAATALLLAGATWGAVRLLRFVVPRLNPPRWLVLATRQVAARPALAVLQVSALGLGLLALMLLVLLRTDLIASWRAATPPDAPNRFVINLQPDQGETFQARLKAAGVARYDWFPMVRGRLTAINGQPVSAERFDDDRARRLVEREFNLSHGPALPGHNQVVAGRWRAEEAGGLSVEEGLAQTLGVRLGDRLSFDIAGAVVESRISSLRKVDWGSMRVNFFVIFPLSALPPELPITYISAYKAPTLAGFDNALVREFPNITNIDVSASVAQVQRVLDQVIRAVEFLFFFTLAAGLVVLLAAITATRGERAREYAVMRALGASSRLLGQVQRAELLGVGALAGLLASLAAAAVGWGLARWVFEFAWGAPPWMPLAGAAAGAVLALAAGWWGLREVLRAPVVATLRSAAE